MKKSLALFSLFSVLIFSLSANAKTTKNSPETLPTFSKKSKTVVMEAPVESLDVAKRTITLKAPDGTKIMTKVDDNVKNLDQIKPGDIVVVKYYESIAWKLKKEPTNNPTEKTTHEIEKPEGREPGMVKMTTTNLIAIITAINEKAGSVTLKKPDESLFTIKVKDPANLKLVKVGDQVSIRYSESMAVSVEKKK